MICGLLNVPGAPDAIVDSLSLFGRVRRFSEMKRWKKMVFRVNVNVATFESTTYVLHPIDYSQPQCRLLDGPLQVWSASTGNNFIFWLRKSQDTLLIYQFLISVVPGFPNSLQNQEVSLYHSVSHSPVKMGACTNVVAHVFPLSRPSFGYMWFYNTTHLNLNHTLKMRRAILMEVVQISI